MAVFAGFLVEHPEALALVPSMAAVRGSIATSMAARVSTKLHLGILPPEPLAILRSEWERVIILALATSVYAGGIVSLVSGLPLAAEAFIGGLSGLLAILVLAPSAAVIASQGYRRGIDPDNVMAPILTVLGDVSTVPTLAAVVVVATLVEERLTILALATGYASISLLASYAYVGERRVLGESLAALAIVGVLEAFTGTIMVERAGALVALGVLHAVPSIMEDAGAASSVFASKLSTLIHLYGPRRLLEVTPARLLEVLVGSLPALTVLTAIAYATAPIAGFSPSLDTLSRIIIAGGVLTILAYSILAFALVYASYRIGLDPDNVVIPLLTSAVDAGAIPILLIVASLLA